MTATEQRPVNVLAGHKHVHGLAGKVLPPRCLSSLELKIGQLIDAGDCAAVALVKEEIDSVGTPDLQTWAKGHAGLFVPLAADIQLAAASIEARYPDLLDPKSPYQSADAYVIALAQIRNTNLVPPSRVLLDVCDRGGSIVTSGGSKL